MTNICSICFDDNNLIKTNCNHYFHLNCIKQIIFPKCPCCKSDLTLFLNNKGVSNKKIKNNIKIEQNRLFIQNINTNLLSITDKYDIICNNIKLNKQKWKNIIKSIILPYIQNNKTLLLNYSIMKYFFKLDGIFIYYCDLKELIINLLSGYSSNILQWIEKDDFNKNIHIKNFIINLHKKIKNNFINKVGVLFIINDTINNKKFIFKKIFYENTPKLNYMYYSHIIKSLLNLELEKSNLNKINNPEYKYLQNLLNLKKQKILQYHNFTNFIKHKINNIFIKHYNENITGLIEIRSNAEIIIFEIIYNNTIVYKNKTNNEIFSINNFNDLLINNINSNETFIIVYLLDKILLYDNLKYLFGYNISKINNIYQTNKLNNNILESILFQEFNGKEILKKKLFFNYKYL
jgi:hypothetical protein